MATFYSDGVGGNYPERLIIQTIATINSQSVSGNYSNVTITCYGYYNPDSNQSYNVINPTEGFQYIRIDATGATYKYSGYLNPNFANTSPTNKVWLMSWTGNIYHNADGTKTTNINVYQDCPGVTTLDYLYGSHNWTLTTIPRASTPTLSASSVNVGSSVTIYTNRASTSFTHAFDYTIGSANVTFATQVADSYAWTLPLSIADQIKTSTSGTVTITCHTWSGATLIGSKSVTLTAVVPNTSTFKPTVSLSIAEATTAMAGAGFWLANKSSIRATASSTFKYSATLSSYAISINGVNYTGSPATSAVITTTGTKTISVTVTDSRGYTATASTTATFIALPAPSVSASSVAFGSSVTITTNRPTTALTHTLKYAIGSISATQITTGVTTSYAWTVPTSAIAGLSNAASGTVTVTQDTYNGAYLIGTTTKTFTATIPSSVPTTNLSTVPLESAVTVTTNRVHTNLTHTLKYTLGTTSLATVASSVGASYAWTLPASLASALPSSTSGTMTFTLYTYNGTALVGSNTKTVTATIPNTATYKPVASIGIAEATAAMVGAGFWLANKSAIKATASATYKYGATFVSYAISINGVNYTSSPATSAVITSTGVKTVSVTVTDSRGYTGTASTTATFIALPAPTLSASSVAFGGSLTVTTNRPSTALTHTLKYAIGTITATSFATGVGASYAWTVPTSAIGGFTNASSNTVTITQESYNGANLIGTTTKTFTGTITKSNPSTNVSTVELGSPFTITTNRIHTTLTHTIKYTFGTTTTETTVTGSVGSSYQWTPPISLASALPSGTSGTMTLYVYTYNGTALVGSDTEAITVTIPSSTNPTVTASISEGTIALIGMGAYIAGNSSLKVVSTATPKEGATIVSYAVLINGTSYSGSTVTSSVISSTGNIAVSVTVTDSRGYTGSYSTTVPFVALSSPTANLSTVALGSPITITTHRATANITHTLKYTYGTQSGTVATSVGASYAWTPANTLASGVPSSTSSTATISQESYFNAVLLGTKTLNFTITIPDTADFKPVPTITSIVEGATGLSAFTVFIKTKSRLTVTSSASFKYGATSVQHKVTIADTVIYYGSPITTGYLNLSGDVPVVVTVTDSRGYVGTSTISYVNFVDYVTPQITAFNAIRSGASDTDLSAPTNFSISPISNQNTKSYTLRYRVTGGSWTTASSSTSLYSLNSTLTASGVLDGNSTYDVELVVADYFTSVSKLVQVSTSFVLMDFNSSGKGIAFGKVSETDNFEVSMPAVFEEGIVSETGGGNVSPISSLYYPTGGMLINICDTTVAVMVVVEIIGHGYTDYPVHSVYQTYWASSTLTACFQLNNGAAMPAGKFLIEGGRVKLWISASANYQTFIVRAYCRYSGDLGTTIVLPTLSNSIEPTATTKVTCTVKQN